MLDGCKLVRVASEEELVPSDGVLFREGFADLGLETSSSTTTDVTHSNRNRVSLGLFVAIGNTIIVVVAMRCSAGHGVGFKYQR